MPSVPVDYFRNQSVTHIVSLGPRCATTYNLRRYYNFGSAYPFDWWITPLNGIVKVLERMDVEWIYNLKDLMLTKEHGSVLHVPTGILLHHEFQRDTSKPNTPVFEHFADAIKLPRDRTAYLFEKFLALDDPNNRVVFVREEGIDQGLEAVLSRHFSNCRWALVQIPSIPEDEFGWMCDPAKWDALFASLHLTLDPLRHRPFEGTVCEHVEADFVPGPSVKQIFAGSMHPEPSHRLQRGMYAFQMWFRATVARSRSD